MIQSKDISFIVQGSINRHKYGNSFVTNEVVESIKTIFLGAEIILSCWKSDDIRDIKVDKILKNDDPGGFITEDFHLNVNRQIKSSYEGAKLATRKYCVKVRSDLLFKNSNILKIFNDNLRNDNLSPILVTNLTSINPERGGRVFALCDWVHMSSKENIIELFNIPCFPEQFIIKKGDSYSLKFNAEQWIVLNFLHKVHPSIFNEILDGHIYNEQVLKLHENLIKKFFIVASYYKLGIKSTKYPVTFFALNIMYTTKEWKKLQLNKSYLIDIERYIYDALTNKTLRSFVKRIYT